MLKSKTIWFIILKIRMCKPNNLRKLIFAIIIGRFTLTNINALIIIVGMAGGQNEEISYIADSACISTLYGWL